MKLSLGFLGWATLGILAFGLGQAGAQVGQPVVISQPVPAVTPHPVTPPAPVLAWDSESKTIDAHTGDPTGQLAFNFTNISSDNVVILNVHPGCGCTTAQLPPLPWTIPAGSNGTIGVTINLQGKAGTLHKNLMVKTDKSDSMLRFTVNIIPVPLPQMTAADRTNALHMAMADRQAVFKGDCAVCHVKQGAGKYFKDLYDADCAICHEGPDRASMVPNLHTLKETTNQDFWKNWIAHGKPGSLMPAFSTAEGGPLTDMQITTLARYLSFSMAPHPTFMQAPGGQHTAP